MQGRIERRTSGKLRRILPILGILVLPFVQALESCAAADIPGEVRVTVDLASVVNTMRGGIGASWHAIEQPMPYADRPDAVFGIKSHGGSGWGGYPPAEDDAAWVQIDRHARWLGLDWNRVEFEQRIYEPERGQFSWDNPEMKILYRILDGCEKNRADVFLQQMWGNVKWNTYPEWRDDAAGRIHSAPLDVQAFADGLAALVEHLVKQKGYTCIRWVCLNNEPGAHFSWWQEPPNKPMMPYRAVERVRKALDAKGLTNVPISGMDISSGMPKYKPHPFEVCDQLGAYDFHSYGENFDWRANGAMAAADRTTAEWTAGAHQTGKAFFLSEFGTMANGWGADHPGPGSFNSVLKDAELVVRRMNAGVDGFNRWSFINRGDLDGQWQFIETWDRAEKKLLREYTPHPNTYFLLGLLPRFTAKHSDVLACTVTGGRVGPWPRVFAAMLRSPKGNLTLAVVNDAPQAFEGAFDLRGLGQPRRLHRYAVTEPDRADLKIESQTKFSLTQDAATYHDRVAPMSLTIYSTYKLGAADDGVIAE